MTTPPVLPVALSPFVGREAELAQVHALLDDVRLLTLTGSGGCGKTRLALEVAHAVADRYPGGIAYVELAPLGETSSVAYELANELGLYEQTDRSYTEAIVARLRDRRALVIVDNCEHLLDQVVPLVDAVLRGCPPVDILTTSRQPLELEGETTWRVPSMSTPSAAASGDVAALTQCDAVRLFIDRARRARPDFAVDDGNAPHVAAICHDLDGIPLAIELAASRVRNLSVADIAAGLDDRFRLLRSGRRGALPRQQTLLSSVEWSHQLLDGPEAATLRRLAVFSGGFTEADAADVVGFGDVATDEVPDVLARLVDRSLVQFDVIDGRSRYRLLETIKQFAWPILDEAGELADVRARHARHYARFAAELAPRLEGGGQRSARDALESEHDNLRVALEFLRDIGDVERLATCAIDLTLFWFQSSRVAEGRSWLGRALDAELGDPATEAWLAWGYSYLSFYSGAFEDSLAHAERATAVGAAGRDQRPVARAMDVRADIVQISDPYAALPLLEDALEIAVRAGDEWAVADIEQKLAFTHGFAFDHQEAISRSDRAMALALGRENPFFAAWDAVIRGWFEVRQDPAAARERASRARPVADDCGDLMTIANVVLNEAIASMWTRPIERVAADLEAMRAGFASRGASEVVLSFLDIGRLHLDTALGRADDDRIDGAARATDEFLGADITVAATEWIQPLILSHLDRDPVAAPHRIGQLRELGRRSDNVLLLGLADLYDAVASMGGDDPSSTADHCRSALAGWEGAPVDVHRCQALDVLAWACASTGQDGLARRLLATTDRHRAARGWRPTAYETAWRERALAALPESGDGGSGDGESGGGDGAWTLDEAVTSVLRSRGRRSRPATGWGSLTPTELEVAALVAEGLTNPQVADRLFVSRATVKTHLSHIYTKLGISTRAQLAASAAVVDGVRPQRPR